MRYKKKILTPNVYIIGSGDEERHEDITTDRLKRIARTHREMRNAGFLFPAPYFHGEQFKPINIGSAGEGVLKSSKDNAGFWDKLWIKDGALCGEVEVERDDDISRVGKTVKETSIYVVPEFTDGNGKVWKDVPLHIALVTHPIEGKGQENFKPVQGLALSMSMATLAPGESQVASVGNLLSLLKTNVEIDLPTDTNTENFMDRLRVALMQKKGAGSKIGQLHKPPEGANTQQAPLLMSFSQKQLDALLTANTVNPDTGKPYTKEELEKVGAAPDAQSPTPDLVMAHPAFQTQLQANKILMSHLGNEAKKGLVNRINTLIGKKIITKEYADATIAPMLNDIQMSFDDSGNVKSQPIHILLDAFEKMPPPATLGTKTSGNMDSLIKAVAMSMGHVEEMPTEFQQLAPADAAALADSIAKNVGL